MRYSIKGSSFCALRLCFALALFFLSGVYQLTAQQPGESDFATRASRVQQRAEWFHQQRAYPRGWIPAGVRFQAVVAAEQMRASQALHGGPSIAAGWVSIGPQPTNTPYNVTPVAGRVTALAVDPRDPNVVYLGAAQGGTWKTTDGGVNWTPLTDGQPSLAVGSIVLDPSNPDTVYVGTGEGNFSGDSYYGAGILKSTDGGQNWTQFPGPFVGPFDRDSFFGGGAHIADLTVHPTNNQILLAAVHLVFRDGVYRSADGGMNWTNVLPGARATAVIFDPTDGNIAYAALGDVFPNANNGFYRSTDGGLTWTRLGVGFPSANVGRIALAMAPSATGTLYAGVHNTADGSLLGFFKSVDGGANWIRLNNTPNYCDRQCWYDNAVVVHPSNAKLVFVGGAFGVDGSNVLWRSTDGGASWTNISRGADGFVLHADLHAFAFANTGKLYVGTDGGAYSADDPTPTPVNWANLVNTLSITQFYGGMSIDPSDVNTSFAGTQDNGTQKYSGNPAWFDVVCGDGGWTAIDFITPSTVYSTCELTNIFKSTMGGREFTWNRAQNGINTGDRVQFIPPFVMDPSDSQTLYFGTFRVYQTTSGASSWRAISPDLAGGQATLTTVAVAPSDPNTVYVATSNSLVQVTTNARDASPTWMNRSSGLPPRFVTQMAVDPASAMTAYITFSGFSGFAGDNLGHVFTTMDSGASWTDISGNLPNTPVNDIVVDPDLANTMYVGTDVGVFSTSDGGTTWSPLGSGLPNVAVLGLKLHRGSRTLRAATHGRGMWDLPVPLGGGK